MIPVKKVPKPKGFDKKVKVPGNAWRKAHPNARRPKALWSMYLEHLADGFAMRCGYAAMLDPTGGTVDHYRSVRNYPAKTYEWSNYRYVSHTLNASKKNADDAILDPYDVKPGWFELLLPSLELQVSSSVPAKWKAKAEATVKRLKLANGRRVIRWRQTWYDAYQRQEITLDGLERIAPLLAAAVRKHAATPALPCALKKAKP